MERSGGDAAGTCAADIIESDTAGEFVWGLWNRGNDFPAHSTLPRFRPSEARREFASSIKRESLYRFSRLLILLANSSQAPGSPDPPPQHALSFPASG